MPKVALLALHGMGTQTAGYADDLARRLRQRMGDNFSAVHFVEILYQDILQPNQQRVWGLVRPGLRWPVLRNFVLSGLGDAAGFEDAKEARDSVYALIQIKIAQALLSAYRTAGDTVPIVILARSLGCHVLSCYLWDAQHYRPAPDNPVKAGIWADLSHYEAALAGEGNSLTADEIAFLRGDCIRRLLTTGCNIPIFVAAHAAKDIVPFDRPTSDFEWHNYYDTDDVLGWPLAPMSPSYGDLVVDHKVGLRGSKLRQWFLESWNPLSHRLYWEDDAVLDPLEATLYDLIGR